jgi:hypothetical protein
VRVISNAFTEEGKMSRIVYRRIRTLNITFTGETFRVFDVGYWDLCSKRIGGT